jgi:predicted RNA-binding Zn ribbon-like protein
MPASNTEPRHIELIRAFANTLDVEDGTDSLTSRSDLTRWLHEHDLLLRRTPSSDEDLALARQLREGLREALEAHHDGVSVDSPALRAATAQLPLRMDCSGDGPALEPVDGGVRGALARLLVAVNEAVIADEWRRLKVCRDETCQWAYFDATKNRSKSWCGPACGNKAKTRSYRERQKVG